MRWIFWYVGAMNLLLITAALARFKPRKSEWKRILPVLSMLMYNFGTMLVLSGDEIRLFYFTFPVTPVLFLLVMREEFKTPASDRKKAPVSFKKVQSDDAPAIDLQTKAVEN